MRQVQLIIGALDGAKTAGGLWFNRNAMTMPRIFPKETAISPFNALILQLNADDKGYKTSCYTFYDDARADNNSVVDGEKGVPFNWYNWKKYQSRSNPEKVINRPEYEQLSDVEKADYKSMRQRVIRTLFNADQTVMPLQD